MFEPRLELIPEPDGQFSLFATTRVPHQYYSARNATRRAPANINAGAHVVAVRLNLKYRQKDAPGAPREFHHRLYNLDLEEGDIVRAFVMLDDRILGVGDVVLGGAASEGAFSVTAFGDASKTLGRPPLTPALCQGVVVAATPNPGKFTTPSQQLVVLGVVDDTRARIHRAGVQTRMAAIGYTIDMRLIESGPAVTVAQSRNSVFANAQ
jgi:hypothetical protein